EDDYVVTANGYDRISSDAPREIDEIEREMAKPPGISARDGATVEAYRTIRRHPAAGAQDAAPPIRAPRRRHHRRHGPRGRRPVAGGVPQHTIRMDERDRRDARGLGRAAGPHDPANRPRRDGHCARR